MTKKSTKRQRKQTRVAEYQRERAERRTAAAAKPAGVGGSVPTILLPGKEQQADCRLVNRAVEQRWPIGPDIARVVVQRLVGIVETTQVMCPTADGGVGPDEGKASANAIAASRVLAAMVAQNQRDEIASKPKQGMTVNVGVAVNGEPDSRRQRTLAIAERIRAGRVS